jgi:hypothetical protein
MECSCLFSCVHTYYLLPNLLDIRSLKAKDLLLSSLSTSSAPHRASSMADAQLTLKKIVSLQGTTWLHCGRFSSAVNMVFKLSIPVFALLRRTSLLSNMTQRPNEDRPDVGLSEASPSALRALREQMFLQLAKQPVSQGCALPHAFRACQDMCLQ